MAFTKEQLDAYIQALYDDDGQLSSADYQLIINYILSNGEPETDPRDLIQIRRGDFADLPTLAQGEMAYTLDSEDLYIGGLNGNTRFNKSEVVSIKSFGAVGDGVADDTSAMQAAFDSGKNIILEHGKTYLTYDLTIDNDNFILYGNGAIIKQNTLADVRDFLSINGYNCLIHTLKVQGSGQTLTTLDGIKVYGDNCKITKVEVENFNYSIDVYGDYCVIDDVHVKNANYASCRLFVTNKPLNQFILNNFHSLNAKQKGFVVNGTQGIRDIIVNNFEVITTLGTIEDAQNGFLIDTDADNSLIHVERAILSNAFINVGGSGAIKVQNAREVYFINVDTDTIDSYNSSYGISSTCKIFVENCKLDDRITTNGSLYAKNLKFLNHPTKVRSHAIEIRSNYGNEVFLDNVDMSEFNAVGQAVRIDRTADFEHYVKLRNVKGVLAQSLIGVFTTPPNTTSFLEIEGQVSNYGALTGASATDALIFIRTGYGTKSYYSNSVPTTGSYNIGDIVYDKTPTASGNIGWVCVSGGTFGDTEPVFKTFGTIEV